MRCSLGTRCESSSPFQVPLSPASPTMWLPYTAIDQLLQALRESSASENSVVVGTRLPNSGMRGQGGMRGGAGWDAL